jgi:SAM-dependent methyltransferase
MGTIESDLHATIRRIASYHDSRWAWDNYLKSVHDLIMASSARSVLEVGGGRSPSFARSDLGDMGIEYTSNDISERELSLAPDWVGKAHFDIQTPDRAIIAPFQEKYDFLFSKMVMEHVKSYVRAYENIYTLLKPGGISIAFHPVLFASPFVINLLLPEQASQRLLRLVFKDRHDAGTPKFPAYYSGCMVSQRITTQLQTIGFSEVQQIPFYGHGYYSKFPGIGAIHRQFSDWVAGLGIRSMASYAYTIAIK